MANVLDPPGETPNIAKWAQVLQACLCDAFSSEGRPVCRCSLVPGLTAAWDKCCECDCDSEGQAWVSIPRIYPSGSRDAPFPAQQTSAFRCGTALLAVEFELGVLRCSQALGIDGEPPSAERLQFEAVRALQDHQTMLRAVLCCFIGGFYPKSSPWVLGEWTPLGPRGGCTGGSMRLTISTGPIPPADSEGVPCGDC